MIHYHGGPITPEAVAVSIWKGRHAMISYAHPDQLQTAAMVSQSFALDNGAFSEWKAGKAVNWDGFYAWVGEWRLHPAFDWALIPDVIDGDEEANDALLAEWPYEECGVPVWHLHESLERLERLTLTYSRIALGSSGEWSDPGSKAWWGRMAEAMKVCCDELGRPRVKLHGLRMLDADILKHLPLASADSTNVARNVGLDSRWNGTYAPKSKAVRGLILVDRIEAQQSPALWNGCEIQNGLFA